MGACVVRLGDVPLTTSGGQTTSVLAVLDEMRQEWNKGDQARARAQMIERWTYNRFNGRSLALETTVSLPLNVPPVSKNKLRSLLLTWAARTTKRRDAAIAYANEATEQDLARAEVANAILDYQRQIQDRDAFMMRAMIVAGMHGMVGLYNTFDPAAGPHREREVVLDRFGLPLRDEVGNPVYRDVEGRGSPNLEALTIFDFVTSGEREAQKGKWALIRRWLDPDEADTLLRAKSQELGLPAFPANVQEVETRSGSMASRRAVEAYEMWWRPNKMGRFPQGFFAAVVSNVVVRATPFPYAHGEIPLVCVRVMDVEDDFYGATWMEDAIPQQMGLNHSLQVLAHRAEIAGQVRVLMTRGVAQKWGNSPDGFVEVDSKNDVEGSAKAVELPDVPTDMYQMCDRYEVGIDDTAGVSAVSSSGDVAAETKNARLVAYATQVDEQKNEHTLRNLQEAELVVDKQQLELWQQFVPKQRLVRVIGEDNAISANYFSGAEIRGVDVRLYTAPGSERTRAAHAKSAEEGAMMGMVDPTRAAEMRETGLMGTVDEGEQRQRIQFLIAAAMGGQPVQPDVTINPDIAVRELRLARQQATDPNAVRAIDSLLLAYEEIARQSGAAAPVQSVGSGVTGSPEPTEQNVLPGAQA